MVGPPDAPGPRPVPELPGPLPVPALVQARPVPDLRPPRPVPELTPRPRRHVHARRRAARRTRQVLTVTGCLAIAAGVALGADVVDFYRHSATVGAALIHQEQQTAVRVRGTGHCVANFPASPVGADPTGSVPVPDAGSGAGSTTSAADGSGPQPYALLTAPSIGLVAPVVQGIDGPQLAVAVGHVPTSSWPGVTGTSVLAAHDVTWFSRIDQLQPGDTVSVVTPCTTYRYTVDSHEVVQAGSVIDQTATPRLVLTTCYPTDALFLTSQRYVLYASLDRVLPTGEPTSGSAPAPAPVVPAPPALVAQGLDLTHNPAPLGSLVLTGAPSPAWQQSTTPLDDESAVLSLYFAALRSAVEDRPDWWTAVAPGVPFTSASSLVGAEVVRNDTEFDPVLDVSGSTLVGAALTTLPELAGGRAPGRYRITMTAGVSDGQLVVTGWSTIRA